MSYELGRGSAEAAQARTEATRHCQQAEGARDFEPEERGWGED